MQISKSSGNSRQFRRGPSGPTDMGTQCDDTSDLSFRGKTEGARRGVVLQ